MQVKRLTPEEYSEDRKRALQEIEERNKEENTMSKCIETNGGTKYGNGRNKTERTEK